MESMKVSPLNISLMSWGEDDPVFDDEDVTKPQTPAATSTPVQTLKEDQAVSSLKSPLGKKPCFWELTMEQLSNAASPAHLEPDYSDAELIGYT